MLLKSLSCVGSSGRLVGGVSAIFRLKPSPWWRVMTNNPKWICFPFLLDYPIWLKDLAIASCRIEIYVKNYVYSQLRRPLYTYIYIYIYIYAYVYVYNMYVCAYIMICWLSLFSKTICFIFLVVFDYYRMKDGLSVNNCVYFTPGKLFSMVLKWC